MGHDDNLPYFLLRLREPGGNLFSDLLRLLFALHKAFVGLGIAEIFEADLELRKPICLELDFRFLASRQLTSNVRYLSVMAL